MTETKASTNAWERSPAEPNKWFERFTMFLLLGPDRSIMAAFNQWRVGKGRQLSSKTPQSWRRASDRWDWTRRAEQWDEAQRLEKLQIWQERQTRLREQEWTAAQALLAKAGEMLGTSLTVTRDEAAEDGQTKVTVVQPARWNMADAAKFLDTASKLGRLAAGMAVTVDEHRTRPVADMTDDELLAIARDGGDRLGSGSGFVAAIEPERDEQDQFAESGEGSNV